MSEGGTTTIGSVLGRSSTIHQNRGGTLYWYQGPSNQVKNFIKTLTENRNSHRQCVRVVLVSENPSGNIELRRLKRVSYTRYGFPETLLTQLMQRRYRIIKGFRIDLEFMFDRLMGEELLKRTLDFESPVVTRGGRNDLNAKRRV